MVSPQIGLTASVPIKEMRMRSMKLKLDLSRSWRSHLKFDVPDKIFYNSRNAALKSRQQVQKVVRKELCGYH
jgi:hypothetical protein